MEKKLSSKYIHMYMSVHSFDRKCIKTVSFCYGDMPCGVVLSLP